MKSSALFQAFSDRAEGDTAIQSLVALVNRVVEDCINVSKTVIKTMPEYTLHDDVHLKRVLDIMGRLIPRKTLAGLQPLELAALILSAALHDVGMAAPANALRSLLSATEGKADEDQLRYLAFREAYPHLMERQRLLRRDGCHFEAQEIEAFILAEYLREGHAERGRAFIFERYGDDLRYDDFGFAGRLAQLCYSHTEDPSSLQALPCWELVRTPGEYCNWRFLGVVLRLADILDFDPKRTPAILFEHLGIRSAISVREWKKHRSVAAWDIGPGRIAFAAQCQDPVIEKCIRDFVASINRELVGARAVLSSMHDAASPGLSQRYNLDLPMGVDARNIGPFEGPEGPIYRYVDMAFQLDRDNIISMVLGVNLYADRTLFIRELLQNAVDACRHRAALHHRSEELGPYEPDICVQLVQENNHEMLIVQDNGIGMDDEIVENHFARVGRSYYTSGRFLEERTTLGLQFKPISQFGIGVLSVFMAGNRLRVETRRYPGASAPLSIEIAEAGSLFWFRPGTRDVPGTKVSLRLTVPSSEFLAKKPKSHRRKAAAAASSLLATVAQVAPHVEFPITVEEGKRTRQFRGRWRLPDSYMSASSSSHFRSLNINLTTNGPEGLDGLARIFLLEREGGFVDKVFLDDEWQGVQEDWVADSDGEDLRDYLQYRFAGVEHVHVDDAVKEGRTYGYSAELQSEGRWSQQGFGVPYPLFPELRAQWSWLSQSTASAPQVPFPFPVSYDLDLSGDFALPLSADRKSVLPTQDAKAVCQRMCLIFAQLLLETLGKEVVHGNRTFFEGIRDEAHDPDNTFGTALRHFLGCPTKADGIPHDHGCA